MLKKIKNLRSQSEGFTIIEVMIVLAIAALILLIVFLAVPALQRSSRNTTIKNDASTVSGGITTFESNDNGLLPTGISTSGGVVTLTQGGGGGGTPVFKDTVKVNGSTNVTLQSDKTPISSGSNLKDPGTNNIVVYTEYKCDGTQNTRAAAVVYDIENGSSTTTECLDD